MSEVFKADTNANPVEEDSSAMSRLISLRCNRGEGFEFINNIVGGAIPRKLYPSAVEKGIRERMDRGLLAGFPIVDIQIDLYDGKYHPVDSSDMAFQIAGSIAFSAAAEQANPCLLEPVMSVSITVPEQFMGNIIGDLNGRRGAGDGCRANRKKADNSGKHSSLGDAPVFDRSQVDDKCTRHLHHGILALRDYT